MKHETLGGGLALSSASLNTERVPPSVWRCGTMMFLTFRASELLCLDMVKIPGMLRPEIPNSVIVRAVIGLLTLG